MKRLHYLSSLWLSVPLLATVTPALGTPLVSAVPAEASAQQAEPAVRPVAPVNEALGPLDRATATDVPNQSKTIQMLLEMQGKNPGLAGGELPRQEVPGTARPAASESRSQAAQALGSADPANPFGTGNNPIPNSRPAVTDAAMDWTQAQPSRFGGGLLSGAGNSAPREGYGAQGVTAGGDDDDDRWIIPRPIVRFVRQNRELVIAVSVLLLLLIWGAAAMSAGRRNK